MRGLLVILMLLVCFNIVLMPIATIQFPTSAKTRLSKPQFSKGLTLVNGTYKPCDPGSGGGGPGTI